MVELAHMQSLLRRVLCLTTVLCIAPAVSSIAQITSDQIPKTCDSNYYDLLAAKGYLEGAREMEAAQRIILKADSVLEYSCFNEDIIDAGADGNTFSGYGLQGGPGNPPEFDGTADPFRVYPNDINKALTKVVEEPLTEFLYSFRHIYLGGTLPIAVSANSPCNPMNVVWHAAKCENFDTTTWVTLDKLADSDIRFFPDPCNSSDRKTRIQTAYKAVTIDPSSPPKSGSTEKVDWFTEKVTGSCSTSMALQTGVQFQLEESGKTYDEAVCIKPGCAYDGTGSCH